MLEPKTIKPLEKREANLCDQGFGNSLLDIISKAKVTKEKINKLDFIKIKTSMLQRISRKYWISHRMEGNICKSYFW